MSFPINICSHNTGDVLSWEMVFHHVISTFTLALFQLSTYQQNVYTVIISI